MSTGKGTEKSSDICSDGLNILLLGRDALFLGGGLLFDVVNGGGSTPIFSLGAWVLGSWV